MTHPGLADAWARALSHASHYTRPTYGPVQGLPALRAAICERRTALVDGLRRCGRGRLELGDARAGMHLVVRLPGRSRADGDALVDLARANGLALYAMAPYYLDPPDRAELLMGYAAMTVAEIEGALAVFERCLDAL